MYNGSSIGYAQLSLLYVISLCTILLNNIFIFVLEFKNLLCYIIQFVFKFTYISKLSTALKHNLFLIMLFIITIVTIKYISRQLQYIYCDTVGKLTFI